MPKAVDNVFHGVSRLVTGALSFLALVTAVLIFFGAAPHQAKADEEMSVMAVYLSQLAREAAEADKRLADDLESSLRKQFFATAHLTQSKEAIAKQAEKIASINRQIDALRQSAKENKLLAAKLRKVSDWILRGGGGSKPPLTDQIVKVAREAKNEIQLKQIPGNSIGGDAMAADTTRKIFERNGFYDRLGKGAKKLKGGKGKPAKAAVAAVTVAAVAAILLGSEEASAAEKAIGEMVNENGGGVEGAAKGFAKMFLPDDAVKLGEGDPLGAALEVVTYGFYPDDENGDEVSATKVDREEGNGVKDAGMSKDIDSRGADVSPDMSVAPGASASSIPDEVPSAPGSAPAGGQGEGAGDVKQGEGVGVPGGKDVVPGGSGGGLGDVGGAGVGSRGVGGGSEGSSQGSGSGGDERRKFKEAYEGGGQGGDGDAGGGNLQIEESGSEGQESDSGGDDDKGGLDNPFDDSVGGVGGDRANVLIDGRGVVGVVGDLVSLISVQNGLGLAGLVADWDVGGGGEGPDLGPRGGFLGALEGLLVSALDGKELGASSSGVLGLVDLVADWGVDGNDGGPLGGGGGDGPGRGGLVANSDGGNGTDGSEPTVGPRGGRKDGGQRTAITRTTTAGPRTVQAKRYIRSTVTTTTQRRSTTVKAPTAVTLQSQKIVTSQTPTATTNTDRVRQPQNPTTKPFGPSDTTAQTQNPSSRLSYSE